MGIKLGMEAKLFRNSGSYSTPTWVEMPNVKDLTLNLEAGEADVTTRGNAGWRATVATLKDGSIEFEMVWDTADDVIAQAKTALVEEIVNFSPDPRDRENLGLAVQKFNAMATKAKELVKARLNSPALSREIEAALSAVGVSFTNSPESSASTPDP